MRQRILVPLDGSPLAEHALPFAETIAGGLGAALVLLRVPDPLEVPERARREAQEYLDPIAARLARAGVPVVVDVPEGYYQAADAIVGRVPDDAADLIVMATHGRSGFQRLLYGSVAEA